MHILHFYFVGQKWMLWSHQVYKLAIKIFIHSSIYKPVKLACWLVATKKWPIKLLSIDNKLCWHGSHFGIKAMPGGWVFNCAPRWGAWHWKWYRDVPRSWSPFLGLSTLTSLPFTKFLFTRPLIFQRKSTPSTLLLKTCVAHTHPKKLWVPFVSTCESTNYLIGAPWLTMQLHRAVWKFQTPWPKSVRSSVFLSREKGFWWHV